MEKCGLDLGWTPSTSHESKYMMYSLPDGTNVSAISLSHICEQVNIHVSK
jgi:hypothetical protein